MQINRGSIGAILIVGVLLFIGAGLMESQVIVPEKDYFDISSPSVCGAWSIKLVDCYTGNSGRTHCYYDLYYNNVKERGSLYSTSDRDGTFRSYTSTHGNNTLKITGCGYKCWTYQCAITCLQPEITFGNVTFQSGKAAVPVTISSGSETQNIDLYKTQVYVYNGIEWIDISSQLDPTSTQSQTITLKWQLIEGETGKAKVKLANTCGYVLDWEESDEIEFTDDGAPEPNEDETPIYPSPIISGSLGALLVVYIYIYKNKQ